MNLVGGIAVYFVIWWTVLFAILPIGVRSQEENEDIVLGTTHSAPADPRLGFKAIVTSIVSAAIFGAFYLVTEVYGFTFNSLPHIIPGT